MKHMILIFFAASLSSAAIAQDIPQSEVPSLTLNAFQGKFPNATDVEWEKKGELFKADFEIGKRDHDLWIDKSGNIKKHKEDISKNALPAAITKKIQTDFKEYTIDDVDKVEENGVVLYYVELDGKTGDKDVVFGEDGSVKSTIAD